jgi:TrmH family RNA methyltransferase
MAERTVLRSASSPVAKRVRAAAAGKLDGVLLLEGERLVEDARASGLELELVLVSTERAELADRLEVAGLPVTRVEPSLAERLSSVRTAPGCVALAAEPAPVPLERLLGLEDALLVCVAGVADPGNLGAVARGAEAAGAAGLVVLPGGASPWSPKALRGSMGSLLRVPVCGADDAPEVSAALEGAGWTQLACATRGGVAPENADWRGRAALWIGAETGDGPALAVEPAAVTIPMAGAIESLNVAVAASVVLFAAAAARRRGE